MYSTTIDTAIVALTFPAFDSQFVPCSSDITTQSEKTSTPEPTTATARGISVLNQKSRNAQTDTRIITTPGKNNMYLEIVAMPSSSDLPSRGQHNTVRSERCGFVANSDRCQAHPSAQVALECIIQEF